MAPRHGFPINPTICFQPALLFHPHPNAALRDTKNPREAEEGRKAVPWGRWAHSPASPWVPAVAKAGLWGAGEPEGSWDFG